MHGSALMSKTPLNIVHNVCHACGGGSGGSGGGAFMRARPVNALTIAVQKKKKKRTIRFNYIFK